MIEYFTKASSLQNCKMGFVHTFAETSSIKPSFCRHCSRLIWGFYNQRCKCKVCGVSCHKDCVSRLAIECRKRTQSVNVYNDVSSKATRSFSFPPPQSTETIAESPVICTDPLQDQDEVFDVYLWWDLKRWCILPTQSPSAWEPFYYPIFMKRNPSPAIRYCMFLSASFPEDALGESHSFPVRSLIFRAAALELLIHCWAELIHAGYLWGLSQKVLKCLKFKKTQF